MQNTMKNINDGIFKNPIVKIYNAMQSNFTFFSNFNEILINANVITYTITNDAI